MKQVTNSFRLFAQIERAPHMNKNNSEVTNSKNLVINIAEYN